MPSWCCYCSGGVVTISSVVVTSRLLLSRLLFLLLRCSYLDVADLIVVVRFLSLSLVGAEGIEAETTRVSARY